MIYLLSPLFLGCLLLICFKLNTIQIDLEQLETIFVNESNNVNAATNGYYVEKYKQSRELEKNIKIAVEDLQNEGKKIAFIKKGRKIIAVVGYKVT